MSKWIVFYNFNGKNTWEIVEATDTLQVKEIMFNKHKSNNINITEIDAYVSGMIEPTEEEKLDYRNRVISLI